MTRKSRWPGRGAEALRDARGGIAVTAALAMLPICLLVFAAVEFHNFSRQRTALQNALDSAALAVARAPMSATQAELRTLYVTVLKSQLELKPGLVSLVEAEPDPVTGAGGKPELTSVGGKVIANATLAISPIIASFFIEGDLHVSGGAEVYREAKPLEVSLVLDTTGTMRGTRLTMLKAAAKNFVTSMESAAANSTDPGAVKIGMVPFTATVKIDHAAGSTIPAWMDTGAISPIHSEIFWRGETHRTTGLPTEAWGPTRYNRFTLLRQMGLTWGGCVESRPYPYDVQDDAPITSNPSTLFVPYFWPDEPDQVGKPSAYNRNFHDQIDNVEPYTWQNSYVDDTRRAIREHANGRLGAPWAGRAFSPNNQSQWNNDYPVFQRWASGDNTTDKHWKVVQGRLGKYNTTAVDLSGEKGPHRACNPQPIKFLSSDYSGLRTAIDNLIAPNASTNINIGLAWGWYLVSPKMPFGASPASNTRVKRIVIILTDGENRLWHPIEGDAGYRNGSLYSAVGYPWQNRLGTTAIDGATADFNGPRTTAMNNRLDELCDNMKAAGVIVYTMRLEVPAETHVIDACATPGNAHNVTDARDLDATFRQIARSIQNLRIAS